MESYGQTSVTSGQALDFTSSPAKDAVTDGFEPPVLDLSCKKQTMPSSSNAAHPLALEPRSISPVESAEKLQETSFSDSERKSPFEGRSFMVTPPSESDSPRKIKFEPIFNCTTGENIISQATPGFSPLPMNIPVPIVSSVLPTLLTQSNAAAKPLQIIGAPATSTTPPIAAAAVTNYPRDVSLPTTSPDTSKKAPRPFKAYPKDPLSLTMGPAELIYDQNSNEAYSEFRKRMLESVRRSNEGTNIKMRRVTKSPNLPTSTVDEKDAAYWERRRKNNEAAKRSRDARRAKEDEIAIRAAFLEQENMKLKYELVALRNETAKLRCMVYST